MKLAIIPALGVLAALVITPCVRASDFSFFGDPAFSRSLLLSTERQREAECAALAYLPYRDVEIIDIAEVPVTDDPPENLPDGMVAPLPAPISAPPPQIEFEKILPEAEAEKLKSAALQRLISDLGDEKMALENFEGRYSHFEPDWDFSEEAVASKAANREKFKPVCQAIYDAARTDQLETVLSPASASPIALPDIDTCLAYDLLAQASTDYPQGDYLHDDRGGQDLYGKIVGPKGKKRQKREEEIRALADGMSTISPELANVRLIACMSVFATKVRE